MADEKKFLHDLANPITTAVFLIDVLVAKRQKNAEITVEQLQKVQNALKKSNELIRERRELLGEAKPVPE